MRSDVRLPQSGNPGRFPDGQTLNTPGFSDQCHGLRRELPKISRQSDSLAARTRVLRYCSLMSDLTPAQRTASTAKLVLLAGALFVTEALMRGSATRAAIASAILAAGTGLLILAKRSD